MNCSKFFFQDTRILKNISNTPSKFGFKANLTYLKRYPSIQKPKEPTAVLVVLVGRSRHYQGAANYIEKTFFQQLES